MPTIRGRLRSREGQQEGKHGDDEFVEIDAAELSGIFSAPQWLRDAGITAWLFVGVFVLLAGVVWFLSLTHVIFLPLVTAGVIAAVAGPLVDWLADRRVPRI